MLKKACRSMLIYHVFFVFLGFFCTSACDQKEDSASITAPELINQVQDPEKDKSPYVPENYYLFFNDEFNGTALNNNKWNTLAPWGVQFYSDSQQKQAFVASAVSIQDGYVRFTAKPSAGYAGAMGQPYISGSITSNHTFTQGYFEARVKVPAGKGLWPALWLTSSTRWPPEWDIFEIVKGRRIKFYRVLSG